MVTIIVSFSSVCCLFSASSVLFNLSMEIKSVIIIYSVSYFLLALIFFHNIFWTSTTCQSLIDQIDATRNHLEGSVIVNNYLKMSARQRYKSNLVADRLKDCEVNALSSMKIDKQTILSCGTSILTYVIILVQLKQSGF